MSAITKGKLDEIRAFYKPPVRKSDLDRSIKEMIDEARKSQ